MSKNQVKKTQAILNNLLAFSSLSIPDSNNKIKLQDLAEHNNLDPTLLQAAINTMPKMNTKPKTTARWEKYMDRGLNLTVKAIVQQDIELLQMKIWKLKRKVKSQEAPTFKPIKILLNGPKTSPETKTKEVPMKDTHIVSVALDESQRRTSDGRLAWTPSQMLIDFMEKNCILRNKYNRPVIPAFGGENDLEIVPGFWLWNMISKSGNLTQQLAPTGAWEGDLEGLYNHMISSLRRGEVKYLAGNKFFSGPAQVFDIFGDDGARIYAATPSAVARGAYCTSDRGVQVYVANLSSNESIEKLASMGLIKNKEKFLKRFGSRPKAEVDGMSLAGRRAMPGKSRSCQFRALGMKDTEEINKYQEINTTFAQDIREAVKPDSKDNEVESAYNKAIYNALEKLDDKVEVRYGKGMLEEWNLIKKNTLILDVNALKGRNKDEICRVVEHEGVFECDDLVVGMLQDIGTGSMSCSWQLIMYLLWELPNHPVFGDLAGKFGFRKAIRRFFVNLWKALDEFDKGLINDTMSKIFEEVLNDELITGKRSKEKLAIALWNNVVIRKEVQVWVMNFLRKNKFAFQTEAMEKIGQLLPEKKYLLDHNELPNENYKIQVELHDGEQYECNVAYLKDNKFWKKMECDQLPMIIFRHPVSDKRVKDMYLVRNPNAYGWGELAPGLYANSSVIKNILTGDTDGDTEGHFPCLVPVIEEDGKFKLEYSREDYAVLYSCIKRTVDPQEEPTNPEYYMSKVTKNPIKPYLLAAERICSESGQQTGSSALLQAQIVRLHDAHLTKKLDGDLFLLNDFSKTVLGPVRKEIVSLVELAICLQKKNVNPGMLEAMNNILFGNEVVNSDIHFDLARAIVCGTNKSNKKTDGVTKEALDAGRLDKFSSFWASGICKVIRQYLNQMQVTINGVPVEYAFEDRDSRFADQIANEDPELVYGINEDLNWGITNKSNLVDALAHWGEYYNSIALKVKERILKLTNEDRFEKDLKKNKVNSEDRSWAINNSNRHAMLSNPNRLVNNSHWSKLTPGNILKPETKNLLGQAYCAKMVWSGLSLRLNRNMEIDCHDENDSKLVNLFCDSMDTDPSHTYLAWIVATFLGGKNNHGPYLEPAIKWPFERETLYGDQAAELKASEWLKVLETRFQENHKIYQGEWILSKLSQSTKYKFFKLLKDAVTMRLVKPNYNPFAKDALEVENSIIKKLNLDPNAGKALNLMWLVNSNWIPTEYDFKKIHKKMKEAARLAMGSEKKIWREKTNSLLEQLTPEEKVECWRVSYENNTLVSIINNRDLYEVEVERCKNSTGANYYFQVWGLDAIKEHGIEKSQKIGAGGKLNPRVPILINTNLWNFEDDYMDLKPIPICKSSTVNNPIVFQHIAQARNMHATALVDDDGNQVALLVEPLSIMRLILAFDKIRVSNQNLEARVSKGKTFLPVNKWWQDHEGNHYQRYLCKMRAFNNTLESIMIPETNKQLETISQKATKKPSEEKLVVHVDTNINNLLVGLLDTSFKLLKSTKVKLNK